MSLCFSLKPFGGHAELHHGLTRKQMTAILTQSVSYWMMNSDLPPMREALFYKIEGEEPISEWAFPKRSYFDLLSLDKNENIIGIEIKSSEEDFMNDKKWHKYLEYCNQFYFAFPLNFPDKLIPSDDSIGILRVSGEQLKVIRRPKQRTIKTENRAEVLYRVHLKAMSRLCRYIELDIRTAAENRGLPLPDLLEVNKYQTPTMFWEISWKLNESIQAKLPFTLNSNAPFSTEDVGEKGWKIKFSREDWIKIVKPVRKKIHNLSVSFPPFTAIEQNMTGKTKRCQKIRSVNALLNSNFAVALNELVSNKQ